MEPDSMTGGRYRTGRKSPTWHKQAECRNYQNVDWWFSETPEHIVKATTICRRCPVAQECANTAIENVETFGIWGGLTPEQLRKARSASHRAKGHGRGGAVLGSKNRPAQCGTESGYHRHRNANEQPCLRCSAAHADATRRRYYERKARQQQNATGTG